MPINHPAIEAYLDVLMERHVEAGLEWLDNALGQEGSGLLHHGNPRRSSTQDEYPAEQLGNLRASIDAQQVGRLTYAIGSYASKNAQGYAEAVQLESRPPSQGGRHWAEQAAADPEFRRAIVNGKIP